MNPRLAAGIVLAVLAWSVAAWGVIERWWWSRRDPPVWMPARAFAGAVEVRGAVKRPGVRPAMARSPLRDVLAKAGPKVTPHGVDLGTPVSEGALIELASGGMVHIGWMAGERLLALGLRIELNRASVEDLQALPGIGPVIAERIARWRASRGPIRSVEELGEVPGVGPKTLEVIRPHLKVGEGEGSR